MMWVTISNVSLVYPHTHMCPHVCMQTYKKQGKEEEEEESWPVQQVHSVHFISHWLETECSYHTTLRSKTDGNLAPPKK